MKVSINPLLELLYPKQERCALCGKEDTAVLCERCAARLRAPVMPCPVCGRAAYGGVCRYCASAPGQVLGGVAAWDYAEPSAAVITGIKFRDRRDYLPYAAGALQQACRALPLERIDAVAAVPCHWLRQLYRGFNQAEELAIHTARLLNKPYLPNALRRPGYVRPASRYTIGDARRLRAAQSSFAPGSAAVKGLTVLLVDDVLTSGATLRTCAHLLKEAGAAGVYTAALAAVPAALDKRSKP